MAVSLCNRLEAYFKARPGEWIDGMVIAKYAGCYGWRTRISELRVMRGMNITNRQWSHRDLLGRKWRSSMYRYLPADLLAVAEAQEHTA